MTTPNTEPSNIIALTSEIVAAFVSNNSVPQSDLPTLIQSVKSALDQVHSGVVAPTEPAVVAPEPRVSVRKSVTPDYLICLDDGRKLKSLKRHLKNLGMTPEQYRAKWNLPADYPMVSANYSAKRSALAKQIGLGQLRPAATKAAAAKASKSAAKKAA